MPLNNFKIENYVGLVKSIANKYSRPGLEFDDLVQEGLIAVWKCSKMFDEKRGTKFESYASPAIHSAMRTERNTNSHAVVVPQQVAADAGRARWKAGAEARKTGHYIEPKEVTKAKVIMYSIDNPVMRPNFDSEDDVPFNHELVMTGPDNIEQFMDHKSKRVLVNLGEKAVNDSVLDNREWVAIREYYGLGGEEPLNFRQIGINQGNVSRQYIHVLMNRGLKKLRQYVKNRVKVGDL